MPHSIQDAAIMLVIVVVSVYLGTSIAHAVYGRK